MRSPNRLALWISLCVGLAIAVVLAAPAAARMAYVTGSEHEEIVISAGPGTAAAEPGNYAVPVDLATQTTGTAIPLGGQLVPLAIAITPDGSRAYAVDGGEAQVVPIDTATNTAGTPIPTGIFPEAIAISPDGSHAYTADFGSDTVTVIDIPAGTTKTIATDDGPSGIAITPDGSRAYVTNYWDGTVSPIDLATETVGTAIPVGNEPWGIAITPDGSRAYVANFGSDTVSRIDIPADTVGATIPVAERPQLVAITPAGGRAFTIGGGRPVTPIDLATDTAETGVVTGDILNGLAVLPDGSAVYLTDDSEEGLRGILQPGNTLTASFPTGERPQAIAIAPNQPPEAAFSTSPASPAPEANVSFDASGSTDPDGEVTRYDWDFGDGNVAEDGGASPEHAYAEPGTYQVTLTTTDDEGCSTKFVFTGQTAHCNGSSIAQVTHSVTVAEPVEEPEEEQEPPETPGPPETRASGIPTTEVPRGTASASDSQARPKRKQRCLRVVAGTTTFTPKVIPGHVVPGVRVRMATTAPTRLTVDATLVWSGEKGRREASLGTRSARVNHWRRVRFALPAQLRGALPYHRKVKIRLRVQTLPHAGSSRCARVFHRTLQTRIVKVFPNAVQRG